MSVQRRSISVYLDRRTQLGYEELVSGDEGLMSRWASCAYWMNGQIGKDSNAVNKFAGSKMKYPLQAIAPSQAFNSSKFRAYCESLVETHASAQLTGLRAPAFAYVPVLC